MKKTYFTKGTCSKAIQIDMEDGVINSVKFIGGCSGNTQGIARLVAGRKAEEILPLIRGIRCGFKPTSCPDQLASALTEMLAEERAKK